MAGPFDVDPTSVERLGAGFALFVNDLLAAEVGRAGLFGFQLDINSQTNTADGGVDAALWRSNATDWLPDGDNRAVTKPGAIQRPEPGPGPGQATTSVVGLWIRRPVNALPSFVHLLEERA